MPSTLHLDGNLIRTEDDIHDAVEMQLEPDVFYGRNLDALWDVICAMVEPPVTVVWTHASKSQVKLDDLFDKLVALFRDAADRYEEGDYRFVLHMHD